MKKMVFTESQIVNILCEARRTSIDDAARRHNITEATIYAWHSKFGRLGAEDVKRLRHLNTEHARRHRLGAKAGTERRFRSGQAAHPGRPSEMFRQTTREQLGSGFKLTARQSGIADQQPGTRRLSSVIGVHRMSPRPTAAALLRKVAS